MKSKGTTGDGNANSGGKTAGNTNLSFTKELKFVLSTQLFISDEDIDKIFERAGAPGNWRAQSSLVGLNWDGYFVFS